MRLFLASVAARLALSAPCLMPLLAAAAPAALPGPAFPRFADAQSVEAACRQGLQGAAQRVRQLERHAPDAGWSAAADDLEAYIEDVANPLMFVLNVHPDPAVRDAAQACALRWQDFGSTLGQNEKIYRAARRVKPRDAVEREFVRSRLENFEDSGVALPKDKRPRAKQLSDRIGELGQQFDKNLRDDTTKVALSAEELAGVPEAVWKDKPRDDSGRVLLGLDYPTYLPVMERGEHAGARERMYRAKLNEGGDANLQLLAEMVKLRREYASLFGFESYADFQLRRRMAESVANTRRFLDEVKAAVTEREIKDLGELRRAKATHLGQPPEQTRLERWDVAFYTERVRRERYTVDQEAFRRYFPPQQSLQFVMRLMENAFGIKYTRMPARLWHDDAQAYAVTDSKTGRALATLYVDLYPRDGKYNHAAVWPLRSSATRLHRTPQAAFVVNMDRNGLTIEELQTLLHEMGHAVHNNLSATRFAALGGTSVKWDFVEAPSQMLEDWIYDPAVLKIFAEVCPLCEPVPAGMIRSADEARHFAKGISVARQHLFASYDMALYSDQAHEPMALWSAMEGRTPLGHVPGTRFPAGFAHIASGGYVAGYYGYLWSLVVAKDLHTAFKPNPLDPKVGLRFRRRLLARGGERPPQLLVKGFLGREGRSDAFFEWLWR